MHLDWGLSLGLGLGLGLQVELRVGLEVGFLIVVICACDVTNLGVSCFSLVGFGKDGLGETYRICRRTGTALLQKTLRTESEAKESSARSRISFIPSNSAGVSGTRSIVARVTAAWKAWKLPRPLVYHLYGLNCGDSRRAWKIDSEAFAEAMHFALEAHVSGVISPWR